MYVLTVNALNMLFNRLNYISEGIFKNNPLRCVQASFFFWEKKTAIIKQYGKLTSLSFYITFYKVLPYIIILFLSPIIQF